MKKENTLFLIGFKISIEASSIEYFTTPTKTLTIAAQHTEGHVAAVARGLVAADATRSTTAPPLRADTLDAATQSAIVAAVATARLELQL